MLNHNQHKKFVCGWWLQSTSVDTQTTQQEGKNGERGQGIKYIIPMYDIAGPFFVCCLHSRMFLLV